jgi:hypothetical protein
MIDGKTRGHVLNQLAHVINDHNKKNIPSEGPKSDITKESWELLDAKGTWLMGVKLTVK